MQIYPKLLEFLEEELGSDTRRNVKTAKTGPGRPDNYLLLAGEGEDAWHVSTTQKKPKAKTVIFSDPFLTFRQPSTYEPELWQELLSHHCVFLWKGSHVPFQELNALDNEKTLWSEASALPFETKEQIIASLQQQSFKTDNIIVIDALQYYQFLSTFLLTTANTCGYSKGIYHAMSQNDSVVCGIALYLFPDQFPGAQQDKLPPMPDPLKDELRQISQNASFKFSLNKTPDNSLTITCTTQSQIENEVYEHITNAGSEIKTLNLSPDPGTTLPIDVTLPKIAAKEIELCLYGHHWDLSEVEGCEKVTVRELDLYPEHNSIIFPALTKAVHLRGAPPNILQNLPASTQELSLIIKQDQDIKIILPILEKLSSLKKLIVEFKSEVKSLDLSLLKLEYLCLRSEAAIELKGIPSILSSLTIVAKKILLTELKEHKNLIEANFEGILDFVEYLPSSIQFLSLNNIDREKHDYAQYLEHPSELNLHNASIANGAKGLPGLATTLQTLHTIRSDFTINLKHLTKLQKLTVTNCNGTKKLKGLSPSIRCLYLVKCNTLTQLDLRGLTELERLDLVCLGQNLRIYSDENLCSIKYLNAMDIISATSFTDEEKKSEARIREMKNSVNLVVLKPFKKIEELISNLQTAQNLTLSNLNSKSIAVRGQVRSIHISDCEALEFLEVSDENTAISVSHCPQLPPILQAQTTPLIVEQGKSLTLGGTVATNISEFDLEEVVIEDSMLMCESFYPSTIKTLRVSRSVSWRFSLNLSRFTQLEELILENVQNLIVLTNLPKTLRVLVISHCLNLTLLDLADIESLESLKLVGMPDEWVLLNWRKMRKISCLHIETIYDRLFQLGNMTRELEECTQLFLKNTNAHILDLPKNCESLTVTYCQKIMNLTLPEIPSLKRIKIEHCHELIFLSGITDSLEKIVIRYNYRLKDIRLDLPTMHSLKKAIVFLNGINTPIYFYKTPFNKRTFEDIEKELIEKKKSASENVEPGFVESKKRFMALTKQPNGVKSLSLDQLGLEGRLTLPGIGCFKELQSLTLKGMLLNSLEGIPDSLTELILVNSSIASTPFSNDHKRTSTYIAKIKILNCQLPYSLDFSALDNLSHLEIIGCTGLQNIGKFPPSLNTLVLRDNPKLISFNTIGAAGLTYLNVFNNGHSYNSSLNNIDFTFLNNHIETSNSTLVELRNEKRNGNCTLPVLSEHKKGHTFYLNGMLFEIYKLPTTIRCLELINNYYLHETVNFKSLEYLNYLIVHSSNGLRRIEGLSSKIKKLKFTGSDLSCLSLEGVLEIKELVITVTNSEFQILDCEDNLVVDKIRISATAYQSTSVQAFLKKYAQKGFTLQISDHEIFKGCKLEDLIIKLSIKNSTGLFGRIPFYFFSNLQHLSIKDSHFIRHLDELPPSLKKIFLANNSLLNLPDLSDEQIDRLDMFDFYNCDRIKTEKAEFKTGFGHCFLDLINSSLAPEQRYTALRQAQCKFILDSIEKENVSYVKREINISGVLGLKAHKNKTEPAGKTTDRVRKIIEQQRDFRQFTKEFLSRNPNYRQHNSTSTANGPVYLRMNTIAVPDSETRGFLTKVVNNNPTHRPHQDCAVMVYDKEGKISRDYYRFNCYNTIKSNLAERSLFFCYRPKKVKTIPLTSYSSLNPFDDDTLKNLELACNNDPNWGMCYSMVELSEGQEFTLISTPTIGLPDDFLIYTNDAEDLNLIIDNTEQKISIALKHNTHSKTITIAHLFKIQEHYLLADMTQNICVQLSDQPLLEEPLRNEIISILAKKPELQILLDPKISPQDKLALLYGICLNFDLENKDIIATSCNSLDIILDLIKNMQGVCRHRSEVFMILAHFLGFPVSMFGNGEHRFAEFTTINHGKLERRGLCLDGAKELKIAPTNPFVQAQTNPVVHSALQALNKKYKSPEEQEKEAIASAKKHEVLKKEREKTEQVTNASATSPEEANAQVAADEKTPEGPKALPIAEEIALEKTNALAIAEEIAPEESNALTTVDSAQEEALSLSSAEIKPDEDNTRATNGSKVLLVAVHSAEPTLEEHPLQKTLKIVNTFLSAPILDSVLPLFAENTPHAPLLELPANQDPVKVAAKIRSEFQTLPQSQWTPQSLYIHDPSDLKRMTETVQITNGNRRIISGPLMTFFQKGGLVIINWSLFTDSQKKRYMSMLEPNGTLLGLSASPFFKIISLIQDATPSHSDAFLTRITPYRLSQSFKSETSEAPTDNQNAEFIDVELYYLHNWRERILGTPTKDRFGYHFGKQGKLLAALDQKKNIRLYNLPESDSLAVFLHRLSIEYQTFHNAEFVQTPPGFKIECLDRPFDSKNENITVQTQLEEAPEPGHFCNANTLHECFETQIVDSSKDNREIPSGWFASYNQFYITETITRYEWQELVDKSKEYPERHFTFTLLPGGEILDIATYTGNQGVAVDQSQVIFSNDTDYCASQLRSRQYPEAFIVDVNPQMTYSQLIAALDDQRNSKGEVRFTYQQHAVLSGLILGSTIILNGQINSILYQQLLPYLYPTLSRIHQNGEEIDSSGRLICVFPEECQEEFLYQYIQVQYYKPEDYLAEISEKDKENANKIITLFRLASQLSHLDLGQPPVPQLTFRRLRSMLDRLNNEKLRDLHFENPLKGLLHYDYPTYSVNYAFLNVVAKYLFSPPHAKKPIRWTKCRQFMEDHKISNWEEAKPHLWKLMNFCSGQTLRDLFGQSFIDSLDIVKGKPLLKSDDSIKKLFSLLTSEHVEQAEDHHDETRHKPIDQFNTLISCPGTRVIFLKGPSGGGKSYALNDLSAGLPKGHYFKGRHQYPRWLAAKPLVKDKPVVLNLEEINTEEPSALDIFKGLTRHPSLVQLDGQYFTPSPEHVIVGSGNQETYQNRSFHKFLLEYSETVLYKLPNDKWLKATIINPILNQMAFNDVDSEFVSDRLLWALHNIHKYAAHLTVSIRDLRSLTQRFIVIYEQTSDLHNALRDAIWYEFCFKIQDLSKRSSFQTELGITAPTEKPVRIIRVSGLYIPESKYPWVEMINQGLDICAKAAALNQAFRRGILIEGPSGVGKSSLFKVILENRGYRKDNPNPKQGYYELSVDDSESTLHKILEAAILGYKIITDELDPCIEELLNDCLEGQLPDHQKYQALIHEIGGEDAKVHPDFFVLASRNPGTPTSVALLNRFHYFIAEAYTESEYHAILVEAKIPNPAVIVKMFMTAQQKNPRHYNARKFFEWLNKQPRPLPPLYIDFFLDDSPPLTRFYGQSTPRNTNIRLIEANDKPLTTDLTQNLRQWCDIISNHNETRKNKHDAVNNLLSHCNQIKTQKICPDLIVSTLIKMIEDEFQESSIEKLLRSFSLKRLFSHTPYKKRRAVGFFSGFHNNLDNLGQTSTYSLHAPCAYLAIVNNLEITNPTLKSEVRKLLNAKIEESPLPDFLLTDQYYGNSSALEQQSGPD